MAKHDERIDAIMRLFRENSAAYTIKYKTNHAVFECRSHRATGVALTFFGESRALYGRILEWTMGSDEEFGALIVNRQVCAYCGEAYGDHAPAGGQCMFASTNYCEGPLNSQS